MTQHKPGHQASETHLQSSDRIAAKKTLLHWNSQELSVLHNSEMEDVWHKQRRQILQNSSSLVQYLGQKNYTFSLCCWCFMFLKEKLRDRRVSSYWFHLFICIRLLCTVVSVSEPQQHLLLSVLETSRQWWQGISCYHLDCPATGAAPRGSSAPPRVWHGDAS